MLSSLRFKPSARRDHALCLGLSLAAHAVLLAGCWPDGAPPARPQAAAPPSGTSLRVHWVSAAVAQASMRVRAQASAPRPRAVPPARQRLPAAAPDLWADAAPPPSAEPLRAPTALNAPTVHGVALASTAWAGWGAAGRRGWGIAAVPAQARPDEAAVLALAQQVHQQARQQAEQQARSQALAGQLLASLQAQLQQWPVAAATEWRCVLPREPGPCAGADAMSGPAGVQAQSWAQVLAVSQAYYQALPQAPALVVAAAQGAYRLTQQQP